MIFFLWMFPSPLLGNPCFQSFSLYQHFPPFLASHAFNGVVFYLIFSPFLPPPSWQPLLSMIVLLAILLPPPSWQPMLSMFFFFSKIFPPFLATLAFNGFLFMKFFPPPPACLLGNPCFQWFSFFSKISPPPLSWQPMLSMIFFLSKCPFPFLGNPCFQWFSFYQFFPPRFVLATHALNDLLPSPGLRLVLKTYVLNDFLLMNFAFPRSWQPLLSIIFFLSNFFLLGIPCFQGCCFYLIFSPFPPPFLATHAFNVFLFIKNFPPPSWQPMLSMIFFLSICSHPFLATSGPGFLEEGSSIDFHPWNLTANIHIQPSFWISMVCLLLPRQSGANPNECEARWGIRRIILYQKLTFQTWSRHNTLWHLFIIPFGNSWKHHDSKYWNVLGTCPGKSRCNWNFRSKLYQTFLATGGALAAHVRACS